MHQRATVFFYFFCGKLVKYPSEAVGRLSPMVQANIDKRRSKRIQGVELCPRLIKGDCLKHLKAIPDNSIDLIIIDPPYQIQVNGGGVFGKNNKKYLRELERENLINGFDYNVLQELVRVMKRINIYIWCSKDQLRRYIDFFEDLGCYTDLLTWHKTNPIPACNNTYLSDTEYLLFFRDKGVKVYGSYATKRKYYVTPTNKADKAKYGHPTIKPLDIIQNLVVNSSKEGDIVLDCFMGSGTTGVACVNTNRQFIGIELDNKYYEIAKQRIDNAVFSLQ